MTDKPSSSRDYYREVENYNSSDLVPEEESCESLKTEENDYPANGRVYKMARRHPAKVYFCQQCNKYFKYPSKIAEHMRKHTGERPYVCDVCGARFVQPHCLKVHERSHKDERPFQCSYCTKSFFSAHHRKAHEKAHLRSNPNLEKHGLPPLEDVSVTDDSGDVLIPPMVGTVKEEVRVVRNLYMCPMNDCEMQSFEEADIEAHIALMHSDDPSANPWQVYDAAEGSLRSFDHAYQYFPYEQIVVQEVQMEGEMLVENMRLSDSKPRMNVCHQNHIEEAYFDGDDFITVPSITEEVEIRTSDEMLAEEVLFAHQQPQELIGQLVVDDEGQLVEIDESQDEERVRVIVNPQPPRKGRIKEEPDTQPLAEMELAATVLEMTAPVRHLQLATNGPRPRRKMREAKNLDWIIDAVAKGVDVDMASPHRRKKPQIHKCEYCGKVDKYPSKIKAHMRTHTGEKPFKCDICGMAFAQNTPLRLHLRRHLDQKPYMCIVDECGERFVSGALLNAHVHLKHFLTRKYVCLKGCGRFFASSRNQRYHESRCFYNRDVNNVHLDELISSDEEDVGNEDDEEVFGNNGEPAPVPIVESSSSFERNQTFLHE